MNHNLTPQRQALVCAVSRRIVSVINTDHHVEKAALPKKFDAVVVGDSVSLSQPSSKSESSITAINRRKNLLSRSYFGKRKILAANLDRLFIVTSAGDLFSADFIDRTIACCEYERIPYTLLMNKSDLFSTAEGNEVAKTYLDMGVSLFHTSTKTPNGIETLRLYLKTLPPSDGELSTYAFCGVSGVGKSSLINVFVPGTRQKVGTLSSTGQGKQTTTMGMLYYCEGDAELPPMHIIDLPGLQKFGVTHVPLSELAHCFSEFRHPATQCRFLDCSHTKEPDCAVLEALSAGTIAKSRYDSYVRIREETKESEQCRS